MDAKYSRYYLFSSVSLMLYKELLFLTEVSIMWNGLTLKLKVYSMSY